MKKIRFDLVRLKRNADATLPIRYSNAGCIVADWSCKHEIAFNGLESNFFGNRERSAQVDDARLSNFKDIRVRYNTLNYEK